MTSRFAKKIAARKFFYRDYYRKAVRTLLVCLAIIFLLIAAIIYYVIWVPQDSGYYATSTIGDLFALRPVDLRQ